MNIFSLQNITFKDSIFQVSCLFSHSNSTTNTVYLQSILHMFTYYFNNRSIYVQNLRPNDSELDCSLLHSATSTFKKNIKIKILKPFIRPYNTERLISFLEDLYERLVPSEESRQERIRIYGGQKCDEDENL